MRLTLEEQQKYLQYFINNATYPPINPNADVTYQTVNLFSSDKCFICFISDCPHYIRWNLITILKYKHIIAPHVSSTSIFTRIVQTVLCWFQNQHNTVCTILVKIDVLDTCGAMICSYFGIAFLLFFMKIENTVYTSFQNSMLLFINGLIFDIMNIQNNQSLEFEWVPMLAPFIRSVNDWRFPWLRNVFIKSFQDWMNSVQQCQGNFTKDAGQKMFISWQTYEGLKISVN